MRPVAIVAGWVGITAAFLVTLTVVDPTPWFFVGNGFMQLAFLVAWIYRCRHVNYDLLYIYTMGGDYLQSKLLCNSCHAIFDCPKPKDQSPE